MFVKNDLDGMYLTNIHANQIGPQYFSLLVFYIWGKNSILLYLNQIFNKTVKISCHFLIFIFITKIPHITQTSLLSFHIVSSCSYCINTYIKRCTNNFYETLCGPSAATCSRRLASSADFWRLSVIWRALINWAFSRYNSLTRESLRLALLN